MTKEQVELRWGRGATMVRGQCVLLDFERMRLAREADTAAFITKYGYDPANPNPRGYQ